MPQKTKDDLLQELLESIGIHKGHITGEDVARLTIHENKVIGAHLVPGLEVDTDERTDGVAARIRLREGVCLAKPVQLCFGLLPERGLQHIILDIEVEERSEASIVAHCTFPNAVEVEHKMDARIRVGPGHGRDGGVVVLPKAHVHLDEDARFKTEFELIRGRVGEIDIDYETTAQARSVLEMIARISGRGSDRIQIHETAHLVGEAARAVLNTYIALRDDARGEVFNTLIADAPLARGHVDCKEIVQGRALARAVPVVQVNHPTAHVTHNSSRPSSLAASPRTKPPNSSSKASSVEILFWGPSSIDQNYSRLMLHNFTRFSDKKRTCLSLYPISHPHFLITPKDPVP